MRKLVRNTKMIVYRSHFKPDNKTYTRKILVFLCMCCMSFYVFRLSVCLSTLSDCNIFFTTLFLYIHMCVAILFLFVSISNNKFSFLLFCFIFISFSFSPCLCFSLSILLRKSLLGFSLCMSKVKNVCQLVLVSNQAHPQNLSAFGFVHSILLPLMLFWFYAKHIPS